jgi:hypothetical protein
MTSDSEPVLLIRVEAQIIVAKLRGSGIEAFIRHDALGVVYGLTVDGCGQQDIMVRATDLDDALVAIGSDDESDDAGEAPDGADASRGAEHTDSEA